MNNHANKVVRVLGAGYGFLLGVFGISAVRQAQAAELPVPCVSGVCAGVSGFVTSGSASAANSGNTLTVTQQSDSVILNWRSFNLSRDGRVRFVQPDSSSTALNRIFQNSASQIFGSIEANGRIFLLNQNGIVFGEGSAINVAGMLATSLDLTPEAIEGGLLAPGRAGNAALRLYTDGSGQNLSSGALTVQAGATISTTEGGSIYMFAPDISNAGTISTPGGQTLLAAGSPVYLVSSSDPNLRGLMVEVGTGGTLVNGVAANAGVSDPARLVGQIVAERGNITLAGLAVNQLGRVSANTSITQNGSVYLQARDGGSVQSGTQPVLTAGTGGNLTLGAASVTEVNLVSSADSTVDATEQPQSQVFLDGNRIVMQQDSRIVAPHGDVTLVARAQSSEQPAGFSSGLNVDSRIYLAPGATIDVSGAEIERSVSSNVLTVELRGSELADSPLQRDGALRGRSVQIDTRLSGTREDGSTWTGSPIGDLSGWVGTIKRDVSERNLNGGSVRLFSQGDVILSSGSRVDVSGGAINYTGGLVSTTSLLGADGRIYDIGAADRDLQYVGVAGSGALTMTNARWGVAETFQVPGQAGRFEAGYVEGKDAGAISISGQRVVLDGDLVGNAVAGRYQRERPSGISATALYRPYDQLPLGGSLTLGNALTIVNGASQDKDFQLSSLRLVAGNAQTQLQSGFGATSLLASGVGQIVVIGEEMLEAGGFSSLTVRANESVELPADLALDLPDFGSIDIRAGTVDVGSDIVAPGGRIALSATRTIADAALQGGLVVRSGTVLDVAGRWINDLPLANGGLAGTAIAARNGGSISLAGENQDLRVESGALLDVSGGARLSSRNRLTAGTGGSLSFTTVPVPETGATPLLQLDGTLMGAALNRGGTLSITTGSLCVASAPNQCQQSAPGRLVTLAPEFFLSGGFSAFNLRSNRGGIEVAPGTTVDLAARNLLASQPLAGRPSGGRLTDFLALGSLPAEQRGAVNFTATVSPTSVGGEPFGSGNFPTAGSLVIGTGAALQGEIGSVIALTSSTRLLVDGTIAAPAGVISLQLDNTLQISGTDANAYFTSQGIWLGDHAVLDASGASRIVTSDLGRRSGDVLDGGSIIINAQRGHVLTSRGSRMEVSGTSAQLDLRSDARGGYVRTTVGSAGGLIDISAAEAVVLGGSMQARSGAPGSTRGGELRLMLDPAVRLDTAQFLEVPYSRFPDQDRTIELAQQGGGQAFGTQDLPALFRGRALLGVNQITDAGFDAVTLTSRSFIVQAGAQRTTHAGRILLSGNLDLSLGRSLTLDAAVLASSGGTASITAPLLTVGHSDISFQSLAPLTTGTGRLNANARQIDVRGNSVLQGFAEAVLRATGDLRLAGAMPLSGFDYAGHLATGGSLELSANQIYPATLSRFTVAAGSLNAGTLTISRPGAAFDADALSAGGQLTLVAPRVVQQGTLRAPFGSISISAPDIELGAGSITSTSGEGQEVLFGSTQGGFDWVYSIGNGYTQVFGASHTPLPSQRIVLDGARVRALDGAVLDSRGGGSLLATEFVPGTTGTVDVLADAAAAGAFAVVPASSLSSIPYDPQIGIDSLARPGTSVHLAGVGGLPEGDYLVLPARYALLPGALLVRRVNGYTDIASGEQYALRDGSTVVAGYFTNTGTTLRDSRTSGFAVMTGATLSQRARYTVTDANTFFTDQAAAAEVQAGRMPRDAGTVAILASASLVLDASLRGSAAADGRGVALDIASDRITVTADGSGTFDGLVLSAADLRGFGAESLLLGGTRSDAADGSVAINTISRSLTLANGAQLNGSEVLLVARDRVELGAGTEVASTTGVSEARDLSLDGDGALLRVARGDSVGVERGNIAGATGDLLIRSGATLRASGGAINLESTRGAQLAGSIAAQGGALSVTGNLISLGAVPVSTSGFVLTNSQLQGLELSRIQLRSRNSIDLYGGTGSALTVLSGGNVDLQARTLRAMGGDALINITGTLSLRGESGAVSVATAGANAPTLTMRAGNVVFDGGSLGFDGFHDTVLRATGQLRTTQDTSLDVAGSLSMEGTRLSGASGVDLAIAARGQLAFTGVGAGPLADLDDLGASISLAGQSVRIGGAVTLHSGRLLLNATAGVVTLDAGARVDLSGRQVDFVDAPAFSAGGVFSASATGDIQLLGGARVNVSGAGPASAGRILLRSGGNLQLAGGSLQATGAQGSGDLVVDALQLPSLDALATQWASGGFSGVLSARQRGAGNLGLAAGSSIRGSQLELTADHGVVNVAGTLRASGATGGRIRISASDGIQISGLLDARPGAATDRNGRVELDVSAGGLVTLPGSRIATVATSAAPGSAADGLVSIRLPRTALQTLVDGIQGNESVGLQGDWSQTAGTRVEGFQVYSITDGSLGASDIATTGNPLFTDTSNFAAQAASIVGALGTGIPSLQVQPGIELRSAGDLALDADWNLTAWRLSQLPGTLTLRAGGNLVFNRSLSDGFSAGTTTTAFALTRTTDSWSYRLIGGADLGSADVLATQSNPAAGNVSIAAGDPSTLAGYRMVRTGTGSIDVRAAGDILLGNSASMIYTAGIAQTGTSFNSLGELGGRRYPVNGGDITLTAGRDIRGADSGQLVTDWLWRVGNLNGGPNARATAWTVSFNSFRQNVGALGGGDVTVRAGNDIDTLSVSAPTIGFQSGGTAPASSVLTVTGRGSVDVRADGDVLGGNFYAGRGVVRIAAGDSIGASSQTAMAPVIALGDATASLQARRDLSLQAVVNPTLLPQAFSQNAQRSGASLFSTYSPASRIALGSTAGDVRILQAVDLVPLLTSMNLDGGNATGLLLYPGTLEADALRGDVELSGSLTLHPAVDGRMSLRAMNDVRLAGSNTMNLIVSDVALEDIPTAAAPVTGWTDDLTGVLTSTNTASPTFNAAVPVRQAAANAGTLQRTQFIAQTGDVDQHGAATAQSLLYSGGPVLVHAGRDVRDLNLIAQNLVAGDVTEIVAGRDISYGIQRAPFGSIASNPGQITVDGPGFVMLEAGRDINLQNSAGITTRGSLINSSLPAEGASISLLAGLNGIAPEYAAFSQRYVQETDVHGAALLDFLDLVDGERPADLAEARNRFDELDPALQHRFLQQLLLVELRTAGRKAASADPVLNGDYSAGFEALETMFPGANPDKNAGETNPYAGDVALYFSRVYTLAGGDISFLAPGGQINAGLSTPPSSFGVPKAPSQLGIVAQSRGSIGVMAYSDLQVNESRVFAADGGDILVWSTNGDIDAGRGAKTAVSAPPPIVTIDENGRLSVSFPAALTGSGIQTLATSIGARPGNVDLFAPRGVVNAGDAGIVAGNLTIGATAVLGADNIKVSGVAVGVPVDAGGLGASLQSVSSQASSASSAMDTGTTNESSQQQTVASVAESAMTWLEVFVLGFGEENCKPEDTECLKRERLKQ